MPYGHRKTYAPRPRRPLRNRGRVAPVPRKKKTVRTYARRNAIAVNRNARHIRRLYKLRYGAIQRNLQMSTTSPLVGMNQPILFDAADFTCERASSTTSQSGCAIFQVNTLQTGIDVAGHFSVAPFSANAYWNHSNSDLIDTGRYLPVAAYYTITVTGTPKYADGRLRLDLFTQKAGFFLNRTAGAGMSIQNRVMPDGLIHMQDMCGKNAFNPAYFRVYKTKHMTINSSNDATTQDTKQWKFVVRPRRARYQSSTTPTTPGFVNEQNNDTDRGGYGSYNVDPRTPFWCMISSNDTTLNNTNNLQVAVSRQVLWRDYNGSSRII